MVTSNPFFAYISRMRYINRWGLMRNTFQENIQEHSHMVAVLAHALAVIRRDVFGGEADPGLAAMAALYHDAPEILTGDLPTPIKYYDPEIRDAYRRVEEFSAGKLLDMLPEELRPAFSPLLREGYDPGDPGAGEGGGQAVGPYQVSGGAESGQQRVSGGGPADAGRPDGLRPAGGGLFPGAPPPRLQHDPGRDGPDLSRFPFPYREIKELTAMKAIVTVLGKDRVGIMSTVCALLAQHNVNILDISQTILQEYFTMVMLVDVSACDLPFGDLAALLEQEGKDRDLSIRAQREDIFNAMHRI